MTAMRGYFGIGVEGISKPGNLGNLLRTTHAFGGSFFFTIRAEADPLQMDKRARDLVDTSGASDHLPLYQYAHASELKLPQDCTLIGIELVDRAIPLPSFRHPKRAAYVLGPEMGALSPELQKKCAYLVYIPMSFCVNVGVAGAITMYDRMISLGREEAERPVRVGGPVAMPGAVRSGGKR